MKKTLLILCALLLTAVGASAQTYKFVCSEWGSIDTGRVADANVTYDTEANTISVAAGTGANNVALSNGRDNNFTTSSYTVTNEQHWFIVVGTNLSTEENASQLWWMNGANHNTNVAPTEIVTLEDGKIILAWDLNQSGLDDNLQNDENYLNGWTGFGLTSTTGTSVISDICFYTTAEAVEAYPSLNGVLHDATPYEFVCTDWVGVGGRSADAGQVTYSEDDNTITVAVTGDNNIALENKYENGVYVTADYYVTKEQCWFVIVGTNLSTASGASYLWWMDGANDAGSYAPTNVVELEDGQVVVAWDLSTMAGIDGNLQNDVNNLNGYTCFGLTTTSTSSVISNINFYTFDEMIEVYPELDTRTPYEFVNSDWVILSDHTDATAVANNDNTITITTTANSTASMGITNGNNPYTTANYYVTNEQCWFIVVGTNLSAAEGASKLWWMDGANWGEWDPTEVVTLSDGQVLVAWDLSTMTEIDVNLQNEKNTLSGWTCFGLTSTTGTSVISDINFYSKTQVDALVGIEWEMTSAGWGTLILPFAATLPDGLTAYSCAELDGTALVLVEAEDAIEANTPYIMSGTANTYTFSGVATNTQDTYTSGMLTGTLVDMTYSDFTPGSGQYVLQNHTGEGEEGLAFYQITDASAPTGDDASTGVTLDAYHCYLTTNANFLALHLPGMATGIEAVESDMIAGDAIYDLSGRKVSKAVKGVYIMNGKKVLVK